MHSFHIKQSNSEAERRVAVAGGGSGERFRVVVLHVHRLGFARWKSPGGWACHRVNVRNATEPYTSWLKQRSVCHVALLQFKESNKRRGRVEMPAAEVRPVQEVKLKRWNGRLYFDTGLPIPWLATGWLAWLISSVACDHSLIYRIKNSWVLKRDF